MRDFKFARGLELKTNGNVFVLKRLIEEMWQAENQKTGAFKQFSISELNQMYMEGTLELTDKPAYTTKTKTADDELIDGYLNNLDEKSREYVVGKRYFLITYLNNYGGTKTTTMMEYALEREWNKACPNNKKPSAAAALKWLSKFEKSGHDIRSLFSRFDQCGNRKKRISEEVENFCLQAIHEDYMTRKRHTLSFVHQKAISMIDSENKMRPAKLHIPFPTMSTMRSMLKGISKEEVYASRYGNDAARHKYRTSIGSTYSDDPLAVVEIDHTRLDIVAVDELTGLPVDRPWLTIVISRHSKCVLGFHLGFEPPSHATVAAALKHAILPKVLHEDVNGIWPIYGIPELLVVDNGLEFHGQALKELCAEIGISISFCPRKKGWAKGTVERFIGTINRNMSETVPSGRTFHSIAERGDYDSVGRASVSLEALRIGIEKYIVDVYHETFHRGIHCKPIQKWETYINYEDIRLPVDIGEFDAISGNIETRTVFHYGIQINNATYNSQELMRYRDAFKGKATVRWNTNDLGHIHVMIPGGPRIEVPVHPSKEYLKGMSYYVWKVIQSDMRQSGLDMDSKVAVANRIQEIRDFMNVNAKKNKQTRQQHLRFRKGTENIPATKTVKSEAVQEIELTANTKDVIIPKFNVSERNESRV
jgi:putative transposase